jgi:hypothetical protein
MKGNNPPVAFEELTPNIFVVHDIRVTQFLRGEGDLVGNRFTLTSWRRDGLFARIRQRGLIMASLDDQIADLPRLPHAPQIGDAHWHPLGTTQTRWSMYDPAQRAIAPLEPVVRNNHAGVMIPLGAVVRRRNGRGIPEWFGCHALKGNQLDLVALDEDKALLYGLAQAASLAPPLPWERIETFAYLVIPLLPRQHMQLLGRLARFDQQRQMWATEITHLTFLSQFLHRVGITLTPTVPPTRLSRKG